MGLGVGMEEMLTQSFEGSDERLERVDVRLQELNNNVYEIALIIRKLIKNGDTINCNQEEIKLLRDRIKALEEKPDTAAC